VKCIHLSLPIASSFSFQKSGRPPDHHFCCGHKMLYFLTATVTAKDQRPYPAKLFHPKNLQQLVPLHPIPG
ncbi:Hypothetical predicted protein, partial [Podarcis lilfordi]